MFFVSNELCPGQRFPFYFLKMLLRSSNDLNTTSVPAFSHSISQTLQVYSWIGDAVQRCKWKWSLWLVSVFGLHIYLQVEVWQMIKLYQLPQQDAYSATQDSLGFLWAALLGCSYDCELLVCLLYILRLPSKIDICWLLYLYYFIIKFVWGAIIWWGLTHESVNLNASVETGVWLSGWMKMRKTGIEKYHLQMFIVMMRRVIRDPWGKHRDALYESEPKQKYFSV